MVHLLEKRALSDPFILMDDDVFVMKALDLRRFAEERVWYTVDGGQERKWDAPATSEHQFTRLVQNSNQVPTLVYRVLGSRPEARRHTSHPPLFSLTTSTPGAFVRRCDERTDRPTALTRSVLMCRWLSVTPH